MSRSIFPAVALQILSNTLSVYASDAFLRVTIVKNGAYFIGFVLTVLAGVSLVLMLSRTESILYRRAAESAEDSFPPQSRGRVMQVFLSPTFLLLCIAFFLLYTFL